MSDIVGDSQDFQGRPLDDDVLLRGGVLDDGESSSEARREGLPASFRMRHDKHYVDQLLDRASPQRVHADAPPLDAALATELAEGIEAASACLTLNSGEAKRTFSGKLAKELLAIELQRAGRLARAAAIAAGEPAVSARPVGIAALMDEIVHATDAARRMVGVTMDVSLPDGDMRVTLDAKLMTLALVGTVDAIVGRVESPGALRLSARAGNGGATVSLEVALPSALGLPLSTRALAARGDQHPWGLSGALLVAAAERIVEAHGGRVELRTGSPGESILAFVLPR